eukprot:CAMPEP_0194135872 /NCGR_PEP_ID=MMETSP0152-20130528/5943_1 /TAXON_ID=1049557 /ORGANISM="Thalassiothrix antarctica, Strain L6-D1" /LENGTH=159 /DNA_ID=CAMNT_0038832299 /DNA_START=87 /DNA_END=563 /DNA_ORIENTATION=+
MDPCCGYGTGDSGCKYFDYGICGRRVCNSCADVPCGSCQQGCQRSDCTDAERTISRSNTRNACRDQEEQEAEIPNFGFFPNTNSGCAKRFVLGDLETVCEPNQLMSQQECEAAANEKITERSSRVRVVDHKKNIPLGCSIQLKNGRQRAYYNILSEGRA